MGGGDWHAGTAGGRLETSLTAVYPYLRWADAATSAWAMAGGGRGTAENVRASGRVGESDLELGLGLFEVRRRFAGWFGLRAGRAGWARLATGDGRGDRRRAPGAVSDQQRLGIELSPSSRHLGLALDASGAPRWRRGPDGYGARAGVRAQVRERSRPTRYAGPDPGDALCARLQRARPGGHAHRRQPIGKRDVAHRLVPLGAGPPPATGALWDARLHELRRHVPDASWSLDAQIRWVPRFPGME